MLSDMQMFRLMLIAIYFYGSNRYAIWFRVGAEAPTLSICLSMATLLFFYEKVFIFIYAFLEISIELPKFTGGHFNQREAHLLRF